MGNSTGVFVSLFLVTLMLFTVTVSGTTYTVGVEVGDWAKYGDIYVTWWSDPSELKPFQSVADSNNTEWIRVRVQAISGTKITALMTTHFKNGSDITDTYSCDIKTGSGDLGVQIIAANLNEGEQISEAETAVWINETVTQKFAGASRVVNYAGYFTYAEGVLDEYHIYWDKATGFLCAMIMLRTISSPEYEVKTSIMMKMIETNMWRAGSESQPIGVEGPLIVVGAIIFFAIVVLIWKKR